MPNGRLYICPGFYSDDERLFIGDLENGINFDFSDELDIDYLKDCVICTDYHCDECVYINKKITNEYSISPDIQCQLSEIENRIGSELIKN